MTTPKLTPDQKVKLIKRVQGVHRIWAGSNGDNEGEHAKRMGLKILKDNGITEKEAGISFTDAKAVPVYATPTTSADTNFSSAGLHDVFSHLYQAMQDLIDGPPAPEPSRGPGQRKIEDIPVTPPKRSDPFDDDFAYQKPQSSSNSFASAFKAKAPPKQPIPPPAPKKPQGTIYVRPGQSVAHTIKESFTKKHPMAGCSMECFAMAVWVPQVTKISFTFECKFLGFNPMGQALTFDPFVVVNFDQKPGIFPDLKMTLNVPGELANNYVHQMDFQHIVYELMVATCAFFETSKLAMNYSPNFLKCAQEYTAIHGDLCHNIEIY